MISKLEEYKMLIAENIFLLGYEPLRYSIFKGENSNRQDYQIRIEYVNCRYEVYLTADRASITGKYI